METSEDGDKDKSDEKMKWGHQRILQTGGGRKDINSALHLQEGKQEDLDWWKQQEEVAQELETRCGDACQESQNSGGLRQEDCNFKPRLSNLVT